MDGLRVIHSPFISPSNIKGLGGKYWEENVGPFFNGFISYGIQIKLRI